MTQNRILVRILREHRKQSVRGDLAAEFAERDRSVEAGARMRVFQNDQQWLRCRRRALVTQHARCLRTDFAIPVGQQPDERRNHRRILPCDLTESPDSMNAREGPLPFRRRVCERRNGVLSSQVKLRRLPDALVLVTEQLLDISVGARRHSFSEKFLHLRLLSRIRLGRR